MKKYDEPIDTTANRLYNAMIHRGISQADLVKRTGISKGSISQYLSGNCTPRSNYIYVLAKELNVSEQYLLGFDVPMEKPKIRNADYMINVEEDGIYLIECYKRLDTDEKELLLSLAEKLSKNKQ